MILFDVCGELVQLYQESKDNNWNPCSYFKSIWNILDWLNLIFFILMLNRKIDMIISVQSVRKNAAARYNIYNDLRAEANWLKLANYSNVDPRLEAHGKYIYIICYYYTLLSLSPGYCNVKKNDPLHVLCSS